MYVFIVVVRPPCWMTQRPVADHLEPAVDVGEFRVSLQDAVRLPQTVPREIVVAIPLHRVLQPTRRSQLRQHNEIQMKSNTYTDTQTTLRTISVAIGRIHALCAGDAA